MFKLTRVFLILLAFLMSLNVWSATNVYNENELRNAINTAFYGDTIVIINNITFNKKIEINNPGRGGDRSKRLIIKGLQSNIVLTKNMNDDLFLIRDGYIKIQDLKINGNNRGKSGIFVSSVNGSEIVYSNVFQNLTIYNNNGHGIGLHNTKYSEVNNSTIYNNGIVGVALYATDNSHVKHNVIYNNNAEGITIDHGSDTNWIYSNELSQNCVSWGVGSIGIDAAKHNDISSNKITNPVHCLAGITLQNNEGKSRNNIIRSNNIKISGSTHPGIWLKYQEFPSRAKLLNPNCLNGPFASDNNEIKYNNICAQWDDLIIDGSNEEQVNRLYGNCNDIARCITHPGEQCPAVPALGTHIKAIIHKGNGQKVYYGGGSQNSNNIISNTSFCNR